VRSRLSVVIPAYNAAATVGEAIDSVLAQTYADFELVVVDDGSTDETAQIVAARDDPRVRCVRTENRGVAAARNHGIELTSGELVAFLDADDAWQPEKLERQHLALTTTPSIGLSFTSAALVDDDLETIGLDDAVEYADYTEQLLLTGNILSAGGSSVMARRSVIDQVGGFDPQLSQCADWDLWLRLSLVTRFAVIHEPLVLYREVPGTMSSDPSLLERDTFALLDKFYASSASAPYVHLRRRSYANHWMICAGSYLHAGSPKESLRCMILGIRSDPRAIRRPLMLPARLVRRARKRMRHPGAPRRRSRYRKSNRRS
jgi:glycosyltransferase involved in cell wall biosynthesis